MGRRKITIVDSDKEPQKYELWLKKVANKCKGLYFYSEVGWRPISYVDTEIVADTLDSTEVAYGVEWTTGQSDPTLTRIGNATYHKTLPIQSAFKGCVAKGNDIQYYLDADDWNFKAEYSDDEKYYFSGTLTSIERDSSQLFNAEQIYCPRVFGVDAITDLVYFQATITTTEKRIIRLFKDIIDNPINNDGLVDPAAVVRPVPVAICSADDDTILAKGIALNPTKVSDDEYSVSEFMFLYTDRGTLSSVVSVPESYYLVFGASLDGYDGAVRVEVPRFYYWSEVTDEGVNRVLVSQSKVDIDWIKSPRMLVDAWRSTVLNTALDDKSEYGWLGTLPANSLVSVCNYNTWCRGNTNSTTYDEFIDESYDNITKWFNTGLAKPRTSINRATFRTYCTNTGDGSQLISYNNYKAIFFWLWVIEYASFYSQDTYNEDLTTEGYHQGGMGSGVTNCSHVSQANGASAYIPCGFGNTLGNNTGVLTIPSSTVSSYLSSYSTIQSYSTNSSYATIANYTDSSDDENFGGVTVLKLVSAINTASSQFLYTSCYYAVGDVTYVIYNAASFDGSLTIGYGSTTLATIDLSEAGSTTVTVTFPVSDSNNRWFKVDNTGDCEIYIGIVSVDSTKHYQFTQAAIGVPRWRGFDNNFGDIYTNVDGINFYYDNSSAANVWYITDDASLYNDSSVSGFTLAGTTSIKSLCYPLDLYIGSTAEIIGITSGGSDTTGFTDYFHVGSDSSFRYCKFGGYASDGSSAGLGCLHCGSAVSNASATVGSRSLLVLE